MGFQTKKLRVATLFGLVMDNAAPEGMNSIHYLAARARRPLRPKNSAQDKIALERSFIEQCRSHGYDISALMRGREHTGEIITQVNLTPLDGPDIKIYETAKTEPKQDDQNRLKLQVRIRETPSEAIAQELIGQMLTSLLTIEGPVGKTLGSYEITKITCYRGPEGYSLVDAKLAEEEKP